MNSSHQLQVTIYSFSYKKGIPEDNSGNGGGFVFDCRAIPNPGTIEEYKQLTGMDKSVAAYLENQIATTLFKNCTLELVKQSINRYIERNFTHLQISFGCTGGQHRSVYFAEQLFAYLSKHYAIKISLIHREQKVTKETNL